MEQCIDPVNPSVDAEIGTLIGMVRRAEKLERELKEMNKEINHQEVIIVDKMVERDIKKIEVDIGGPKPLSIKPMDDVEYSMDQEVIEHKSWDNPDFFKFLEDAGEGDVIQTKRTVQHQTRKKVLTELLETEGVTLPNWVKIKPWTRLKYSKAAVKASVA